MLTMRVISPGRPGTAEIIGHTHLYTRGIRGDYVVVPPHYYNPQAFRACLASEGLEGLLFLIGPSPERGSGCCISRDWPQGANTLSLLGDPLVPQTPPRLH